MGQLTGKVALVTGAARRTGMGRAICLRLARDGADIIVTDVAETLSPENNAVQKNKNPEDDLGLLNRVEEIRAMGCQALAVTANLSDSGEIAQMVEKAWSKWGGIDILVNNAALTASGTGRKRMVELDEEIWRRQLDVNLTAPFLITKLVGSRMIERGKGGKIINIGSSEAKKGHMGSGAYGASKFGLIGLTQTLALEFAPYKINVNAVNPGAILTWAGRGPKIRKAMSEGASFEEAIKQVYPDVLPMTPLGRLGMPEDVANAVAFLAGSEADFITGQSIGVNGGFIMH